MTTQTAPAPLATSSMIDEPYVLLVDDHQPSLLTLRDIVRMAGYRCMATGSATDALSLCDLHAPALVVTDLWMPQLDGQGLARWLHARYPMLPILLMTGEYLDDPTLLRLRGIFSEVLTKPLKLDQFLGLLRQYMPVIDSAGG